MSKIGAVQVQKVVVELPVQDIERAKMFYQDVFQLDVSWYMEGVDFCELFLPGKLATLGLVARGKATTMEQSAVLMFEVGPANLEALRNDLQKKGIETTEITDRPGETSCFYMQDTEGNKIGIGGDPRIKM